MNADSTSKDNASAENSTRSPVLFGTLGVLILAVILIAVNYLANRSNGQIDLTKESVHTLSQGSIDILKAVKEGDVPVTVKLFVSPDDDIPAPSLLVTLRDLRSRLEVFKGHAGKNLKVEILRTRFDSDEEDAAKQADIPPRQVTASESIWFGLAASCLDKTSTIPFIPAIDPQMLEYKIIRAISRVAPTPRKTVGLMTPLSLDGGGQMAMMMGGGGNPSYFFKELSADYDVVKVDVNANDIKTNEHTEYTFDHAKGEFTRQEFKDGNAGTKGSGAFTVKGASADKKSPEKLESLSYTLNEKFSGNTKQSELTFSTSSTGTQLMNAKNEGFAYTYTKLDDTKAKVEVRRGIDVLILVHPAGISDEAQWAIDQFILKGGKVLALLDSYSVAASESSRQQNPMMQRQQQGTPTFSGLEKLTSFWGYKFDSSQAVADVNFSAPKFGNVPLIITPPTESINKTSTVTKGLSEFVFAFSGGFTGEAKFGLSSEILLESSPQNQLVTVDRLDQNKIREISNKFVPSGEKRVLALKLSGKFPTAFPQGKPDAPPPPPPGGGGRPGGFPPGFPGGLEGDPGATGEAAPPPAAAPAVPAAPAAPEPAAPASVPPAAPGATSPIVPPAPTAPPAPPAPVTSKIPSLIVAEKESTVYLIGDSDLVFDPVSLENRNGEPSNSNLAFVLNIVDDLAGNGGLITARSRISAVRPFSKLNVILEEANKDLRKKQQDLESEIEKWKTELTSSNKQNPNSPFITVNQKQLEELQKKINDGEKKKREIRKDLNRNIDGIFASYHKWNILGVPKLVLLIGLAVFLIMKSRTAAR